MSKKVYTVAVDTPNILRREVREAVDNVMATSGFVAVCTGDYRYAIFCFDAVENAKKARQIAFESGLRTRTHIMLAEISNDSQTLTILRKVK